MHCYNYLSYFWVCRDTAKLDKSSTKLYPSKVKQSENTVGFFFHAASIPLTIARGLLEQEPIWGVQFFCRKLVLFVALLAHCFRVFVAL